MTVKTFSIPLVSDLSDRHLLIDRLSMNWNEAITGPKFLGN